jgi:hypothetical protein
LVFAKRVFDSVHWLNAVAIDCYIYRIKKAASQLFTLLALLLLEEMLWEIHSYFQKLFGIKP